MKIPDLPDGVTIAIATADEEALLPQVITALKAYAEARTSSTGAVELQVVVGPGRVFIRCPADEEARVTAAILAIPGLEEDAQTGGIEA